MIGRILNLDKKRILIGQNCLVLITVFNAGNFEMLGIIKVVFLTGLFSQEIFSLGRLRQNAEYSGRCFKLIAETFESVRTTVAGFNSGNTTVTKRFIKVAPSM